MVFIVLFFVIYFLKGWSSKGEEVEGDLGILRLGFGVDREVEGDCYRCFFLVFWGLL